jgi:predicted HicB family RNase H-like nuclease
MKRRKHRLSPTTAWTFRGIPRDLHIAVKVAATNSSKSMKAWVFEALEYYLGHTKEVGDGFRKP